MCFSARVFASAALLLTAACATDGGAAGPVASVAPRATAKPVFLQKDLLGQKAQSLDQLLGQASLARREGEGEFRRYVFEDCTLIVILYPDQKGELAAEQLDAAAKASGEDKPDLDACLARGPAKRAG